jgi:hypothetical protein
VGWLVPGQPVNGLGMGTVLAPRAVTVLARVTPQHGRPAAGVLSTVQWVGNALGVALLGIVSYGRSAVVCRTPSVGAPSFPVPRCMHYRPPGRSAHRIVPQQPETTLGD